MAEVLFWFVMIPLAFALMINFAELIKLGWDELIRIWGQRIRSNKPPKQSHRSVCRNCPYRHHDGRRS